MSRAAPTTPTHPNAGLRSERALIALRSRLRRVAIGEVLTAGVGLVLVALLAEGLADFVLRLPSWLRVLLLIAGLVALVAGIRRKLIPAIALRPKLSTLALRVERSRLGQDRKLPGVLASGVELSHQQADEGEPESIGWLRRAAAERADASAQDAPLTSLVHTTTLKHNAAGLALTAIVITVGLALVRQQAAWKAYGVHIQLE